MSIGHDNLLRGYPIPFEATIRSAYGNIWCAEAETIDGLKEKVSRICCRHGEVYEPYNVSIYRRSFEQNKANYSRSEIDCYNVESNDD